MQQGMNREFEPGILEEGDREHRTKLWWTVYMIDRKLTYLMGVPVMLHDVDITISKPALLFERGASDQEDAFSLHVHLSRQLGQVLYGM